MAEFPQLVTLRLHQLRCIKELDLIGGFPRGGSEPYLWVTFFALDGRNISQQDPVVTETPPDDPPHREFPINVADGQIIEIPHDLSTKNFVLADGPLKFMMAGCIAVLLEQDSTSDKAIIAGRRAFATEIHKQLNLMVKKRISDNNKNSLTTDEIKKIKAAIESEVKSVIKNNLTLGQKLFDKQDNMLGFTFKNFIGDEITNKTFDFPEIFDGPTAASSPNRFVLSGSIAVAPVAPDTPELCPKRRAALKAQIDKIKSLQTLVISLQKQLSTASPQQKPFIIKDITKANADSAVAESKLPALETALRMCLAHPINEDDTVQVK